MTDPGFPCPFCDVRPNVACRHRPADPTWQQAPPVVEKERKDFTGQGHSFRARRRTPRRNNPK